MAAKAASKKLEEKPASGIGECRSARSKDSSKTYQRRRQEIVEAAELKVDRASLYYYVGSKDDLFDEITGSVLKDNEQLARRIADSSISPRRKLRELIAALMTSYGTSYPLLYIYVREDLSHVADSRSEWSKRMRGINRSIENAVVEFIEQGFADGSFRRVGSARTIAYGILGMLNWSHRWYRPERSESAEEIGKTFAEMVLAGLETPY